MENIYPLTRVGVSDNSTSWGSVLAAGQVQAPNPFIAMKTRGHVLIGQNSIVPDIGTETHSTSKHQALSFNYNQHERMP